MENRKYYCNVGMYTVEIVAESREEALHMVKNFDGLTRFAPLKVIENITIGDIEPSHMQKSIRVV